MWHLFLVCGTFCVEQAQKVIGASELTPSIEGVCIKNLKDEQSSHKNSGEIFLTFFGIEPMALTYGMPLPSPLG
jgi:hypothetical protein